MTDECPPHEEESSQDAEQMNLNLRMPGNYDEKNWLSTLLLDTFLFLQGGQSFNRPYQSAFDLRNKPAAFRFARIVETGKTGHVYELEVTSIEHIRIPRIRCWIQDEI